MRNPFEYGGIVTAPAFCNRQQELQDLLRAIKNGEKLFMYAERRIGKTSLVKLALSKLSPEAYLSVYVDLWPTDSETSFVDAFASAVTEACSFTPQKMLEFARQFFAALVPSVTLDDQGKPEIHFGITSARGHLPTLEEVLRAPVKIAKQTGKHLVIVLDEFQQVLEYENDLVERQLRTAIQTQRDVSYIFLGSRKHLVQKMVLDKKRPLYRSGGHYPVGPIAEEHWHPFISGKFKHSNKQIAAKHISWICNQTQGHPFYTQHLCHALWELVEENSSVTEQLLETAIEVLLKREDYAYSTMWDALALNQRRLLEGLSLEPNGTKIFAADFVQHYELRSPSNVQRAVQALLSRDIIDQEEGSFFIVDRFFRLWLQNKHD